jgi:hypothetical protein
MEDLIFLQQHANMRWGQQERVYFCDLDFSHQFSNRHPLSGGVFSTQTCAELLADIAIEFIKIIST